MVVLEGSWDLGCYSPCRLGLCHRQFRVVDRYWSRRNADFRHPPSTKTKLAHFHQSRGRGDDSVRCYVRGHVSAGSYWSSLACSVLAISIAVDHGSMAAVPQSSHLGRLRRFNLFHCVIAVLVHWADSRFGNSAGQRQAPDNTCDLWDSGNGLAWLRAPLGEIRNRVSFARRPLNATGTFRAHSGQLGFRCIGHSGMAHHDFSSVFCGWRDLLRIRDGAHVAYSHPRRLRHEGFHHHAPPAEHGEGDAGNWSDRRIRLLYGSFHRLVQRESLRALHLQEPGTRSDGLLLLAAHHLQHCFAAITLVAQIQKFAGAALVYVDHRECGDVVGALRDRRY